MLGLFLNERRLRRKERASMMSVPSPEKTQHISGSFPQELGAHRAHEMEAGKQYHELQTSAL